MTRDGMDHDLHSRLVAFARDCVTHGDMTPSAERALHRILDLYAPWTPTIWSAKDLQMQWDAEHLFPFIEDEDAYGVYGYGHQDKTEFARLVNEYDELCGYILDVGDQYTEYDVQHLYAASFPHLPDDRFTWRDVTAETPGAFPLTLIER